MPDLPSDFLPRLLADPLARATAASPVVVVTGARQTGKTTLVKVAEVLEKHAYVTLDEMDAYDQSREAPDELVLRGARMVIDEVQRSPELLLAIKRAADERRTPGRFVLTGSANLLLLQRVSETLAGRAVYMTLRPFTRLELLGMGESGAWGDFFEVAREDWPDLVETRLGPQQDWVELARRGGYPTPAYHMSATEDRDRWFAGYTATYVERDVQNLSSIEHLPDFRRLMRGCCLRLGNIMNQADLARDIGIAPSTAQRYLNLLEASYQLIRLPTYAVNRTKRLTKSPKLYWSDTALALHLAGDPEPCGAHLENLVVNDLLAWRDAQVRAPEILYWRTSKGAEVDFVVEQGQKLLAIEVKASRKVTHKDARHLRTFLDEYPELARGALVLYAGDAVLWLARDILAVPWWLVM
jgi:predicted AAA+ superfamily ATPase